MQNIIFDKPYHFIPPYHSRFWSKLLQSIVPWYLERHCGVVRVDCRGVERLRASLAAGHGILIASNHCRPVDPIVLGMLSREAGRPFFVLASAHLFMQGRLMTFFLRRAGAVSIYREGMDRAAVNASVDILADALRPLVIFPEGLISRTNDQLGDLLEGTALIARTAAKRRAKGAKGLVVVHPVAIRYFFHGDLKACLEPVLDEIETRLSWRPQRQLSLYERIRKVGAALLSLKEIEYFGGPREGELDQRLAALIDHLLVPLELEWLNGRREPHTAARVKRLRQAILPDMSAGKVTDPERERRWLQLADLYLAQQLANYPPDYIRSRPLAERFLETVERFEEDLTDEARIHRPLSAAVQVGEAIEVDPARDRGAGGDPLMAQIEEQLKEMLAALAKDSKAMPLEAPAAPEPA